MNNLTPISNDPILKLPNEIFDFTLSFLNPSDLLNVEQVSKSWKERVKEKGNSTKQ